MEIAPGIHWIEKVIGNVYACIEPEGVTLIDTGLRSIDRIDLIFNYLERFKRFPPDVKRILITHADIDHVGNLKGIWDETGAIVLAGPQAKALIAAGQQPTHMVQPIQWLSETLFKIEPLPADHIRSLDQTNRSLPIMGGIRVIPSPGHTAEHISFYHPTSGVLFAGDALSTIGGKLRCSFKFHSADHDLARQSAKTLLKLNPTVFACGHGKPLHTHTAQDIHTFYRQLIAKTD